MTESDPKSKREWKSKIEHWPIDKPIPYARNARKISDQAISSVAGSIKEFGFNSPIIVDGEGVIIAGHTRLRAAQSLGLKTVPVIVNATLSKEQVKAYRLADNRVAEFTEWDKDLLSLELEELKDFDLGFADFDSLMDLPETDVTATESQSQTQSAESCKLCKRPLA